MAVTSARDGEFMVVVSVAGCGIGAARLATTDDSN